MNEWRIKLTLLSQCCAVCSCSPSVPFSCWTFTHRSSSIGILPPSLRLFSFPPSSLPAHIPQPCHLSDLSLSLSNMALCFYLIAPISGLALELYGDLYPNARLKITWWQELKLGLFHLCDFHKISWAHSRCQKIIVECNDCDCMLNSLFNLAPISLILDLPGLYSFLAFPCHCIYLPLQTKRREKEKL